MDEETRAATSKLTHDLRQPLAAIKTWTELVSNSLGDDASEKQRRYITKINGEIGRMVSMLDEFSSNRSGAAREGPAES